MTEAASSPPSRAAELLWCVVCRAFRSFKGAPVPVTSRFHAEGFDTDHLVCAGCGTTLLTVRAPTQDASS